MAEVYLREDSVYVVLHNGIDLLVKNLDQFCKGEYGRKCELYKAYVAARNPNQYAVDVEEYGDFGADLIEAIRNGLQDDRDFIKLQFFEGDDAFTISIVPATHQDYLEPRLETNELDELAETDTVVLVEAEEGKIRDDVVAFLESL